MQSQTVLSFSGTSLSRASCPAPSRPYHILYVMHFRMFAIIARLVQQYVSGDGA